MSTRKTLRKRRAPYLLAVALLAASALLYAATRFNGPDPAEHRPLPQVPPTSQLQAAPQVELTDLTWSDYHGVRLPSSVADGPFRTVDGTASGFSRTPRGALLAAIHIVVRADARWGPGVFEPTITHQVTGPDQGVLMEAVRGFHAVLAPESRKAYAVIEGFRWQGYTPDAASVEIVSAGPGDGSVTVRAATRLQVQWQAGDWRLVAPPGGEWGNSAAAIHSTDGYTLFPAGR
ncbi:hypothetical protein DPM19_09520 [Actinomadura craniellae]|uniref:DUF8175 domain-containing protein n=1 Tax=Actinomadura craniellae TaxID=2231787 RepID=A0A365H790_9ACTN|nr:hypothetical protein [Actinomadura craniellae]RAY14980.1 hypothetical protein DPM19_09520 [Actinomadura craniellae]